MRTLRPPYAKRGRSDGFFVKSIPSRPLSGRMVLGRLPCPPLVEAT